MFGLSRIAALALSLLALAACSGGGSTASSGSGGGSSGSSGSGGDAAVPTDVHWDALPTAGAPSPRFLHTAVWTGSKMLIWGGFEGKPAVVTATGAAYDAAKKMWKPISTIGAPTARHSHSAVWTGSKMIVWGGYGESSLSADGALYDPDLDTWKPMSTANQPAPRTQHSAVWTGSSLIVWGGSPGSQATATGGVYDPVADTWTATSPTGAPTPRSLHTAVWTGTRMIVWGGSDTFDWLDDGATFDPAQGPSGAWVGPTSATGAPGPRDAAIGVWTTSRMLIWGGWTGGPYESTGAIFDPGAGMSGSWTAMPAAGAPSARAEHVGLWTGGDLFVWGGCGEDLCAKVHGDGGRFVPGGGWTPIEADDALSPRRGHAGVFTGTSVLIWGGRDDDGKPLGSGAEAQL